MQFGVLRVLNDDLIAPSGGFGMHQHENMEIISIPFKGTLEHKDSIGNVTVINEYEIQVMSAGTGIYHSEYNKNSEKEAHFLQIWLIPNKKQVEPRYDQISLKEIEKENQFYQILSPNKSDQGVWIYQNAWFSLGNFINKTEFSDKTHLSTNGVNVFIVEGHATVQGQNLNRRDGFGIWNTETISIVAEKSSEILLMEVPMSI